MIYDAIVLAFGKGLRSGLGYNKVLYRLSDGTTILDKAIKPFIEDADCQRVIVVLEKDSRSLIYQDKKIVFCNGGKERFDSVLKALELVDSPFVFIHDGARPCISQEILNNCFETVRKYDACVAAVPAKDTIKIADENQFAEITPERSKVWIVQTPQVFQYSLVKKAYDTMFASVQELMITDDAMVVENFTDKKVKLVMGSYYNIKVTTQDDLLLVKDYLGEF